MSGFDVEIENIRHLLLGAHVVVENANLLVLFCFLFCFLRCYLENTPRNVLEDAKIRGTIRPVRVGPNK